MLLFSLAAVSVVPAGAESKKTESIVLGGGCFWCVEAVYDRIDGVVDVVSGYAGGKVKNPTYEQVSSGDTGHAEGVRVDYDASVISLEKVLDVFWKAHDPTTLNRQGADVGTQYRSVIFFKNEKEKETAELSKKKIQDQIASPIVTEISPLNIFYEAEGYHQDYFAKNPVAGYCTYVIKPKLDKLGL